MIVAAPSDFWPLRLRTPAPPGRVNCYLIGQQTTILVDPGSSFPGELDRLRRLVWRLRGSGGVLQLILLTHHHLDHRAGALILAEELGVPLAAHPFTLERLPRSRRGRWLLPTGEGARLQLDRMVLEVLHTPGHVAGHLCLFEPVRRVLVGGDMVPGQGTTLIDPDEGDLATYLASLRRLAALRPELLLPGHGPPRAGAAGVIEGLIEHRLWREDRVLAALETAPQPLTTIARRAYPELPLLRFPLACRSTLSHLIKLAAEGRAVRQGPDHWQAGDLSIKQR